jgi:hypothetical protein
MDDEHTMFLMLHWKRAPRSVRAVKRDGSVLMPITRDHDYLPNTSDWYGRWRLAAHEGNDWRIDRAAQREGRLYTGINNIHLQDQAVTESMGPITDHGFEHLGPSDRMITRTRRRLLLVARAWRAQETVPPGVDDPALFLEARSGYFIVPDEVDWRDAYAQQVRAAVRPAPVPQAAE